MPGETGDARECARVSQALRLPPRPLSELGLGRWRLQGLQSGILRITVSATVPVNVALARVLSDRYRRPAALGGGKACLEDLRMMRLEVAGLRPHFCPLTSCSPFVLLLGNACNSVGYGCRSCQTFLELDLGFPEDVPRFHNPHRVKVRLRFESLGKI